MALADTTTAPARNPYYDRGCTFGQWINTLVPAEREAITAWLPMDSGWTHQAIAARVNGDPDYPGVSHRAFAVSRHRRGLCSCAQ